MRLKVLALAFTLLSTAVVAARADYNAGLQAFNAGNYKSAQETADAIAAAWEKITDQIGRESQIKLYKASLGM